MQLNLKKFILQNEVGSGSFGDVFKIKEIETGKLYAAKVSHQKIDETSKNMIRDISREVDIISKLNHPSVLKFIGFSPNNFKKKPKPVIVTEFVSNGNLEDLIDLERNSTPDVHWNDTQKLITIYGIASAMAYLHYHNIIHRDLKPENVLMDDFLFPKIADFGLSKISDPCELHNRNATVSIKGTPCYMSPEIWEKYEYTTKCDVYSFAITVYEIITAEKPFSKLNFFEIPLKVKNGYRPEFKKNVPKAYRELIEKCWASDVNDRPSFIEIVKELKTNPGFITESIDKDFYEEYVSFIDGHRSSFISTRSFSIHLNGKFTKIVVDQDPTEKQATMKDRISHTLPLFSFDDFIDLDDDCKALVEEAEKDHSKYFSISEKLIEGKDNFIQKSKVGMKYLFKSLDEGNEEALIYYIKMLIKGNIIPKNLKKARKLISKHLTELSHKPLSLYLNGMISKREKNYEEAKNYFIESIKEGNGDAMYQYGKMLFKGIQLPENKEEAIQYFQKAIEKGCIKSMYKYGFILQKEEENERKQINQIESIKYIKMAADKGYPKAMLEYALILEKNEKNPDESDQYLCKAANAGHVESMLKYGLKLTQKQDDKEQKEKGSIYLKKASDKGNIEAMYYYGLLLFEKDDNPTNLREAARYIKISADNGNSDAMAQYGMMLIRGKGISINYKWAANYLHKAIKEQKNPDALYGLGYLYETGKGVERDPTKAQEYFKLSAKYKSTDALLRLGNDYFDGTTNGVNIPLAKFCFSTCIKLIKNSFVNAAKAIENSYRSNNNLGLVDILAYRDSKNAQIHFREAAMSGYPFAQNNYGFLSQFYFNDLKEAEKMYLESSRINFSFSEYNLGYLYEQNGDTEKALEYYTLASAHEKEPLVFRRQTIYDDSVEISKLLVVCLTNFKLVLYYLSRNQFSFKKYFIKALLNIVSFIKNIEEQFKDNYTEFNETKMFFKFRSSILNLLKKFTISEEELNSIRINPIEVDEDDIHKIQELIKNADENSFLNFNSKFVFKIVTHNEENQKKFIQIINDIIKDMNDVLYEPPYYIFFGQILFKNNEASRKSDLSENESYYKFLNEFGYDDDDDDV